ncbi:MAG: hypothetical protein CMN78_02370 [Spirochaetales bacterium]|nr:hypothetical protein [Spirochaetales bacterium]
MTKRGLFFAIIGLVLSVSFVRAGGQGDATAAKDETAEHYEITYGWFGERDFSEDPVYNIVSEKFNVDIAVVPLTRGEQNAQVNLMVASGEMPDTIFFAGPRAQYMEWARTGVIREIPTFPDSKYPNLSAMWDKMPQAPDRYLVDGKLYAWPKYLAQNPVGNWWPTGFLYRADWAKKLGMHKEQYTVGELMDLARAFSEKDPAGNGPGRTIGYGDDSQWSYIVNAYNTYSSHFYRKDGKFIWGAREPSTLEGIKAFKRLYDDGAYWPGFFAGKAGDINGLFHSGLIGIIQANYTSKNLGNMRISFEDANPDLVFADVVEYMDVVGLDGKRWTWEMTNIRSASIFHPNLSDEKLHRLMNIMDWCTTDEALNTLFFGVPGQDWEMRDGKPVHLWPLNDKGVPQPPNYPSRMLITLGQLEESYTWIDPAMQGELMDMFMEHITRLGENDNFRATDPLLVTFAGENWLKHGRALYWEEYYETIKRIIAGTTVDSIEDAYSAWLKEAKPRADAVLAELNGAIGAQ